MDEREALRVLKELKRRGEAVSKIDFAKLSFPAQYKFITDENRFLSAVCGRRAGKTDGMALKALRTASQIPNCMVLYITLSRPAAKRIMWPKLMEWDRRLNLGAKFNHADLTMTLANGSMILLGGANDEAEIERYRGISTPLIILDEAQAFRTFLKPLVYEILQPATLDYQGQICMIGTPNPSAMGFFHDVTTGAVEGWAVHHWTVLDNPFIPHALEDLAMVRKQLGILESDPHYRREWKGEWVRDEEGLCYRFTDRNMLESMPEEGEWSYVLGMDIGYVDATAFCVLAYCEGRAEAVVVESFQKTQLIPTAIAVEVDKLSARYDFMSIVVDPGGGGKLVVEEMKQRFGIPAKVAAKRGKHDFIELLNGDLRSGALKIIAPTNRELLEDAALLQWDYSKAQRKNGTLTNKDLLRIDDRTPDHLLDAMLYGYRECRQYLYEPVENDIKLYSAEWFRKQEDEILERAIARVTQESEGYWWEQ